MDAAIRTNTPALQERLEALLVEVNGLANRLKATDPRVAIPSASRAALQVLHRYGPQTVPQIARARFSSRQNIQILINRLKEEGLVEFVTNPDHKRSALVRLTARGHGATTQASMVEEKLSTELLPSFSPMELSSAAEVLNRLRNLLDGKKEGDNPTEVAVNAPELSEKPASVNHQLSVTTQKAVTEQKAAGLTTESLDDGELPVSLL